MFLNDEMSVEEAKEEVRKVSNTFGFGWLACNLLIVVMIKLNRIEQLIQKGSPTTKAKENSNEQQN